MKEIILALSLQIFFWLISGQTSTNNCQNDPLVFKLDIRDYLNQLGIGKKISDIDPSALCDLVQSYDYVWLTQIWTPSQFNFQNNINPQQTKDYRVLKNIKEYILDPVLGTTQNLIQLKQSLNQICFHTKFLGEFSFYIGKDSSLLQNQTRFLRIPQNQVTRYYNYNPRYDDDGLIWAVDDFGRTIPNSAVWNLFSQTVITDIKDIIYRQILSQYNLDGIVFLQPSLGLYSFNKQFYQAEVTYYGQSAYLKDFYENFGLMKSIQTILFMGGEDNLNSGQLLLNQGLQLIYKDPVNNYDRSWAQSNFTFDPNGHESSMTTTDVKVNYNGNYKVVVAFVKQAMPVSQKSCLRLTPKQLSNICLGMGIKDTISGNNYKSQIESSGSSLFGIHDWKMINSEDNNIDQQRVAFEYTANDEIEIQYDPLNKTVVFRKFSTNLRYQMYISPEPSTLQYMITMGGFAEYSISFPFKFSSNLKTTSATVQDSRNFVGTVTQQSLMLQFGQILPNLNLLDQTSLNIQIKKLPASQIVAVGVCNQELINSKAHTLNPSQAAGGGAYMIISNGKTLHSEQLQNNQQTPFIYNEGDTIKITYTSGQGVLFDNNNSLNYTVPVSKFIKNVNFCVSFTTVNSAFYLTY